MFYIGINISKNSFNFCIINNFSKILKQDSIPQSSEGFTHFLLQHNASVFVINPKAISKFSSYINHSNLSKTDKKMLSSSLSSLSKILNSLIPLLSPPTLKSSQDKSLILNIKSLKLKLKSFTTLCPLS